MSMITRRRIVAFVLGFTLMWGLLGTRHVLGQPYQYGMRIECPSDRPYRRVVQQPITNCTLLACQRIVCPKDADRCELVIGSDCNTCSRPPDVVVCLSQEELDAAK